MERIVERGGLGLVAVWAKRLWGEQAKALKTPAEWHRRILRVFVWSGCRRQPVRCRLRGVLFEGFRYVGGQLFELFVGELHMVVEVHVAFVLHGDEVDVGVRHFEA